MAEIMRLTAYELERTLTLPRTALVFGILVAIVQASLAVIDTVAMQQAYEGASVLAGATAFDTFYMALNVEASTTLPIACIVLAGDLISRDAHESSRLLIVSHCTRRSSYAAAKVLAAFVLCSGCVVALFALSLAMGALRRGLPLGDGSVPAWLLTRGPEYTTWGMWSPIPAGWSYPAVLAALVGAFSIIETAIVLVVMAFGVRCRTRLAPIVGGCLVVVLLNMLGDIGSSIAVAFGLEGGRSVVGWVADRFSLANYRLGAGFFQTQAGQMAGEAIAAAEHTEYVDMSFPINSFAQLTAMIGAMLIASCAVLSASLRNAGLPGFKRRVRHGKG